MPPHLLHYDAADWPNPACHSECAFWEAVEAFGVEHPLAGPLVIDGPNVPFHPEWV